MCKVITQQILIRSNLLLDIVQMVIVTLLGVAQDGGVPQCGCSCSRCLKVHEGQSSELYPVSIGIRGMCLCNRIDTIFMRFPKLIYLQRPFGF